VTTDLDQISALIQRAGKAMGSEYKLAQALDIPQRTLSDWKAGRRTCVPADRARIAGFAGEDAVQELVRATLATTENTTRGRQLKTLMGKLLRPTGAALASAWTVSATTATDAAGQLIRCIERLNPRRSPGPKACPL
jgi:hypothetical protein